MSPDLRHPLLLDVPVGEEGEHAVAEEEDVRVGIGEDSQRVELLLAGGIEEPHLIHSVAGAVRLLDRYLRCVVLQTMYKLSPSTGS